MVYCICIFAIVMMFYNCDRVKNFQTPRSVNLLDYVILLIGRNESIVLGLLDCIHQTNCCYCPSTINDELSWRYICIITVSGWINTRNAMEMRSLSYFLWKKRPTQNPDVLCDISEFWLSVDLTFFEFLDSFREIVHLFQGDIELCFTQVQNIAVFEKNIPFLDSGFSVWAHDFGRHIYN